jgi:Restriction endonuclease fold toxin 3
MTPGQSYTFSVVSERSEVPTRKLWWGVVVAGTRSKFGATLLAVGLGGSVWFFATGNVTGGFGMLAILVLIYARIGGQARVEFASGRNAGREFDAISDEYIAEAKPANLGLSQKFRAQAKAIFQAAGDTGRTPYFQLEGPPQSDLIQALQRYADRYKVQPVIDTNPLRS